MEVRHGVAGGGKNGGTAFNSGPGSTKRADSIAKPDERAGITCYLVNGVCHQAANRILLPAGILVSAARGYSVSSAIFGTYGKVGFWPCSAPFDQCTGISGDLPECVAFSGLKAEEPMAPTLPLLEGEDRHIRTIKQAYNTFNHLGATPLEAMKFHADLFDREVEFRLGDGLGEAANGLRLAKETVELSHWHMVDAFAQKQISPVEFIKTFNSMTLKFQDDIASALNKAQYVKLLDLECDERVILADPEIIEALYGKEVSNEVFTEYR
ncbi:MAG TPA: hypothetical protein VMT12_04705 [Syntrophales bacterium]|nr:hypothetical protein [Syntrophales bacterium]